MQAHVVAAFEQSLASMTSRLQSLTMTAEQKESELQELRQFIEQLRKQGVEAGLVSKSASRGSESNNLNNLSIARQLSSESVSSVASQLTNHSSVSASSPNQPPTQQAAPPLSPSPSLKKKSWLRSSFSKAFSRSKRSQGSRGGAGSDSEDTYSVADSTWSAPSSPMLNSHHPHPSCQSIDDNVPPTPQIVDELKKQLREKDMVLTDIRLEALSSAGQLELLKETVARMRVKFTVQILIQ